jgi:hypothetical protein
MSPLALPRPLLDRTVDRLAANAITAPMRDLLKQLKHRPTFQEQWPNEWQAALVKGKRRVLELEQIRRDTFTMSDILINDNDIYEWWNCIPS